jgi:hypothetical protein
MQPGVSYVERLRKEGKSSSTVGEAREGRATRYSIHQHAVVWIAVAYRITREGPKAV